jgi:hypothetical protein
MSELFSMNKASIKQFTTEQAGYPDTVITPQNSYELPSTAPIAMVFFMLYCLIMKNHINTNNSSEHLVDEDKKFLDQFYKNQNIHLDSLEEE